MTDSQEPEFITYDRSPGAPEEDSDEGTQVMTEFPPPTDLASCVSASDALAEDSGYSVADRKFISFWSDRAKAAGLPEHGRWLVLTGVRARNEVRKTTASKTDTRFSDYLFSRYVSSFFSAHDAPAGSSIGEELKVSPPGLVSKDVDRSDLDGFLDAVNRRPRLLSEAAAGLSAYYRNWSPEKPPFKLRVRVSEQHARDGAASTTQDSAETEPADKE